MLSLIGSNYVIFLLKLSFPGHNCTIFLLKLLFPGGNCTIFLLKLSLIGLDLSLEFVFPWWQLCETSGICTPPQSQCIEARSAEKKFRLHYSVTRMGSRGTFVLRTVSNLCLIRLAGEPGTVQNWLFSCWHCYMHHELLNSYLPIGLPGHNQTLPRPACGPRWARAWLRHWARVRHCLY